MLSTEEARSLSRNPTEESNLRENKYKHIQCECFMAESASHTLVDEA